MMWIKFVRIAVKKFAITQGADVVHVPRKANAILDMAKEALNLINTRVVMFIQNLGTNLLWSIEKKFMSIGLLWKNI